MNILKNEYGIDIPDHDLIITVDSTQSEIVPAQVFNSPGGTQSQIRSVSRIEESKSLLTTIVPVVPEATAQQEAGDCSVPSKNSSTGGNKSNFKKDQLKIERSNPQRTERSQTSRRAHTLSEIGTSDVF